MTKPSKQPIIGITTYGRDKSGNFYLSGKYVDAVRKAGGLPILLPPGETHIEQILNLVNGIIFAGGGDIEPSLYGGTPHPTISRVDSERDAFELPLARRVLHEDIPVLGICRGFQVLNVAAGGNLIAHLPDELDNTILHRTEAGEPTEHLVGIVRNSRLFQIIGEAEIVVVSQHHQGVRQIPNAWNIVAKAADGVIEALEYQTHPWLMAVLWHPELSLEDPNHQKLFQAFVEECRPGKS